MFQMEQKVGKGTKNVQGNKKCAKGTKYVPLSKNEVHKDKMGTKCNTLKQIMILDCVALNGLMWSCKAFYDLVWPWVALYDLL